MRHGTANVLLFFAPLLGRRSLKIAARRPRSDWAEAVREVLDEYFAQALDD